jgi:type 1 glutamine amidotransferase
MKNIFKLSLLVIFTLNFMSCEKTAIPDKKIKVLIIDGQNNHNWKSTTPIMKAAYLESGRFSVAVSTAPSKKDKTTKWNPDFSKYDVLVSNYNGQLWSKEIQKKLEDYVSQGGGLVIVHAADNAFPQWKEYNKMIGLGGWGRRNEKSGPYLRLKDGKFVHDNSKGRGGSHGPKHEFVLENRVPHPITKGLPSKWKHTRDELYDSLRGPAENIKVIASAYCAKTKRDEPVLMVIDYGKGRVFHSTLGHDAKSMHCVGFVTTLLRGTQWAATDKVDLKSPAKFPTAEKSLVWHEAKSK